MEVMAGFFDDAFGSLTIADIPDSMAQLITYDQKAGAYKLLSADGGGDHLPAEGHYLE